MKTIPTNPKYRIDENGNVYNARGNKLSDHNNLGYRFISLENAEGVRKNSSIHRLVVSTFIGPIPKGMWVNHKNGNKADNRLSNLEITTPTQNHQHARDILKRTYASGEASNGKLNNEAVAAIRALHSVGWSYRRIATALLVSNTTVRNVVKGITWKGP